MAVVAKEIITYGGALLISALVAEKAKNDYNNTELDYGYKESTLEKRKHEFTKKPQVTKFKDSAIFGMPDQDPDDDEFSHFKKKDGSNRYECEKSESPQWKQTEPFKDKFRTNGHPKDKYREYYRWDYKHKDIEIFDSEARYIGSKDPVTGKMYRIGDMNINKQLNGIIK